jgi:hypothetical protein
MLTRTRTRHYLYPPPTGHKPQVLTGWVQVSHWSFFLFSFHSIQLRLFYYYYKSTVYKDDIWFERRQRTTGAVIATLPVSTCGRRGLFFCSWAAHALFACTCLHCSFHLNTLPSVSSRGRRRGRLVGSWAACVLFACTCPHHSSHPPVCLQPCSHHSFHPPVCLQPQLLQSSCWLLGSTRLVHLHLATPLLLPMAFAVYIFAFLRSMAIHCAELRDGLLLILSRDACGSALG